MKNITWHMIMLGTLLTSFSLRAQDKVYYKKNKADDWKITEIKPDYVKGSDINNPRISYSISSPDMLFIINSRGNFLVLPQLFKSERKADIYIKYFLKYDNDAFQKSDLIITTKNETIFCDINAEVEKNIEYKTNQKTASIPKASIAIIVYKNGSHKLFSTPEKVYYVLKDIQDRYYQLTYSAAVAENNKTNNSGNQLAVIPPKRLVQGAIDNNISGPQTELPNNPGLEADSDYNSRNITNKDTASLPTKKNSSFGSTSELDNETRLSLQEKAIINIKELESYIKIISAKENESDKKQKAIDLALQLFASEDSRIEVSSKNRAATQQYQVKLYLDRLALMKYSKVYIEWYDIQYVSKIRKNPDGTYAGFIEFEQRFSGISGDKKLYQDITRKTIEIILKPYFKKSGGATVVQWDVLLGNIGISVAKPA